MPTFFSIDNCLKYIDLSTKEVAEREVKPEVEALLKNNIIDTVYARPASEFRTGAFKESVDSVFEKNLTGSYIEVFNNPNKMYSEHLSWASWNGIPKNSSMNNYIGSFLNDGHGGIISYASTGFYQTTQNQASETVIKTLKISLLKYGITVR